MSKHQASLYELLQSKPGLIQMTEVNPELANRFMASIDRIIRAAKKKNVPIKDVCITGPTWDGERMIFKIKYGNKNP
jgi:hypothetical protein